MSRSALWLLSIPTVVVATIGIRAAAADYFRERAKLRKVQADLARWKQPNVLHMAPKVGQRSIRSRRE